MAFGKMVAFIPHSVLTFAPNQLSKLLLGEKLSIVSSRNSEINKEKIVAINYINKSPRGHDFLKKYCGLTTLPDPRLRGSVQDAALDLRNAATDV